MQNLKKLTRKTLSVKTFSLNALSLNTFVFLSCSLIGLNFSNLSIAAQAKRDFKKVASKISYLSCAVLNGYANKVKEYIDSGADITEVNKTETSCTTLVYDALMLMEKNEVVGNKIMNMLLEEITKARYEDVREEYLNRKNYRKAENCRKADQKPVTVLEKAFDLRSWDLDLFKKLIKAGANCQDSDNAELNFLYGKILFDMMNNKTAK